ncbi:MAG: LiaI-LiaF-like domain-containing protein, partial [Sphingobacteriaceae bacterium]
LVPERTSYPNFADPDYRTNNDSFNDPKPAAKSDSGRFIAGLLLIAIGCWFMLVEFNIIPDWFSIFKLWPIILIVLGVMILFKSDKRKKAVNFDNTKPPVSDWDARSESKSTSNPDDQPLS